MYRALYRKWRPQRFEDVVGQQAIVAALKNQIVAGRVGHAYLFTGVRGTGKTSCAKIFAKAVNCLDPQNGDPCGQCAVCRGIDNGSLLDVVEMDAASNNGVSDIRDLRDETAYTPSACRYKVYIIDEVHMLSIPAFNALLKTLEEPPAHVIFLLATTEIQKVPATILSRCQRYDFTRIRPQDIAERVARVAAAEQLELTPGAADLIARLADGAMRDALSLLDTCAGVGTHIDEDVVRQMAGVTDKSYLFRLSDAIAAGDGVAALALLAQLRQQSVDMKRLADELVGHYRNLMLAALPGGAALLTGVAPEEEAQYAEKAAQTPQSECIRAIHALGTAMERMTKGNDQRIELELALFALAQPPAAAAPAAPAAPPCAAAPAAAKPFVTAPVQPFASAPPTPAAPAAPPPAQEELPPWDAPAGQPTPPPAAAPAVPAVPDEAPVAAEEAPPWDSQPLPPTETPEPRSAAAPPAPPPAPVPGEGEPFAPWAQIVPQLETQDPMLYATLKNSRAYYDGRRVLIDGGSMFRDFIRVNKPSQKRLKEVIQQVTGLRCGIGPYTPAAPQAAVGNAQQALEELEAKGLEVVVKNSEHSRR